MKLRPLINSNRFANTQNLIPGSGVQSMKNAAVEAMICDGFTSQMRGPNDNQQEILQARLGKVDRGVLVWAKDQGVKLQVLQKGEALEQAGVLRDLSGHFEERIDANKIEQIHLHLEELTERIETEKDPEQSQRLRRQKRKRLAKILTHNPCGAAVFTPVFAPLLAPGLSKLKADPTETPTMKSLALHHGADSPEEQKKFYGWLEKLNGDRLTKARAASVQERSRLLQGRPQAQNDWLKRAKENPEIVPLDVTLHSIVVPDAHYFPSHDGGDELLLDRSDIRSIEGWQNEDFRGQWFFLEGKSHLLIRDTAVSLNTPVHELGHVVDLGLEKNAPEFYAKVKPRIERAYHRAKIRGTAITSYSQANPREYIAEGFVAYYEQPQALQSKDPELYRIVDQMVDYCCREAGADRTLDTKLQKMWRETASSDPQAHQPAHLRELFELQLEKTPTAKALSQTAAQTALSASRLGLMTGAAEVALGQIEALPELEAKLIDSVQLAFQENIDEKKQRELFEVARQHGRTLF